MSEDLQTFIKSFQFDPRKVYPEGKAEFKVPDLDKYKGEAVAIIKHRELNLKINQPINLIALGIFEVIQL